MFIFYYAKSSAAYAPHILLEETGLEYKAVRIDFQTKEQQSPAYLKINPKGRVPALITEKGILTETPASTVHVAHAHKHRGARWADDPLVHEAMRAKVTSNMTEYAQMIEEHYLKGPFVLGDRFSFCDPYMALVTRWFRDDGVDLDQFAKIKEHDILMRQRPSMQHVLELHS
jgi:glutathione S-transferase